MDEETTVAAGIMGSVCTGAADATSDVCADDEMEDRDDGKREMELRSKSAAPAADKEFRSDLAKSVRGAGGVDANVRCGCTEVAEASDGNRASTKRFSKSSSEN